MASAFFIPDEQSEFRNDLKGRSFNHALSLSNGCAVSVLYFCHPSRTLVRGGSAFSTLSAACSAREESVVPGLSAARQSANFTIILPKLPAPGCSKSRNAAGAASSPFTNVSRLISFPDFSAGTASARNAG